MLKNSNLSVLNELRSKVGERQTIGLPDSLVSELLEKDAQLRDLLDNASAAQTKFQKEHPQLKDLDEAALIDALQDGILNFYGNDSRSPYVPLLAKGPWVITYHGAVVYDTGGYGMLGFGHAPDIATSALTENHVMANVMTASSSQRRFIDRLRKHVGFTRTPAVCPYDQFICMNSGSEAVSVATRISDAHAKIMTDPGARYEGRPIKVLALKGGFHGRTGRPSQASPSTQKYYQALATFRDRDCLLTVEPNDVKDLERVFKQVEEESVYVEAMYMEPVMGEGNPGVGLTPEFYRRARELTKAHETLLVVDSIQAGLRGQGVLSIVDYPGFQELEAPDMETYSKALNAGQYPLSVLAIRKDVACFYQTGTYGNTMTANPRALEMGCAVLDAFGDDMRNNIVERGREFVEKLVALQQELNGPILDVQGTGLLISAQLDKNFPVCGIDGVEQYLRKHGVNVIHGGPNGLRFTPCFGISSEQIDIIIDAVRDALNHFRS